MSDRGPRREGGAGPGDTADASAERERGRGRPAWLLVAALTLPAWGVQALHPATAVALPAPPWGWAAAALPLLALVAAQRWRPSHPLLAFLGGTPLAVAALTATALFAAPTAVWPTGDGAPGWLRAAGLADSTSSLPFAAAYLLVVANLAISGARLLWAPRPGAWPVVLIHGGLVAALAAAAVGLGNTVRARLWLVEGAPATAAAARLGDGLPVELPFRVRLDDFQLETWEPTLVVGRPDGRGGWSYEPGRLPLAPGRGERLGAWTVTVLAVHPQAAVDGGTVRPFAQSGAGPAAEVEVRDGAGATVGRGWVHARTVWGPALSVPASDGAVVLMPPPKPRLYRSLVRIESADGTARPAAIEVNRPLVVDGWWLYQTGYDQEHGGASRRSELEAVRDPALPGIYAGCALLLAGLLAWLWRLRHELESVR